MQVLKVPGLKYDISLDGLVPCLSHKNNKMSAPTASKSKTKSNISVEFLLNLFINSVFVNLKLMSSFL